MSVWEPERGVEVDELEGGLYMFCFKHQIDVRKVMDKGPWHFNGALLMTHELRHSELPDQVLVTRFLDYDEKNDIEYLTPTCEFEFCWMFVLPSKRRDWLHYMEVPKSHVFSSMNVFRLSTLSLRSWGIWSNNVSCDIAFRRSSYLSCGMIPSMLSFAKRFGHGQPILGSKLETEHHKANQWGKTYRNTAAG
ncbi:hypothetical protein LINGRAPRIM_LOCUS3293 [Linum grandiflorum]